MYFKTVKSYRPANFNLISSTVIVSGGVLFSFPTKTEKNQVTQLSQPVINILNSALCIQLCLRGECIQLCLRGEQFAVHT